MNKRSKTLLVARLSLVLVLFAVALFVFCSCGDSCKGGHTWDAGVASEEDCSQVLYTCTKCSETKQETVENAHDLEEIVVDATCITNGSKTIACKKCDYKVEETIVASHNYQTETIEVTCTRDGAIVYTCSKCNDSYRKVTARATGHNTDGCTWTSEDTLISGCTYNHVESTNCKNCNEVVTFEQTIEKHDYSVAITTQATCQTAGVKTKTCKGCGASEEIEYANTEAHNWNDGETSGNITTYTCTNEGCELTKTAFSAKTEVSAEVPSDALQSAGEVELMNATVKLDEEVLKQLEGANVTISAETLEDEVKNAIINAMSEEDREKLSGGAIFNFTLAQNGDLVSEFDGKIKVTIPFTLEDGMDPDNIAIWYISEDGKPSTYVATYTEINGVGYAVFETTHFSYYTVIRMTPAERCQFYGHQYKSVVVAPSCNKQGYTIDTCSMCRDVVRHTFTEALTHNYESTVVAPTCSEKGYTSFVCANCKDKYYSDYTDTVAHNYEKTVVAATCSEKGYTLNKCQDCGYAYTENETSILEHTYENNVCKVCGKKLATGNNIHLTTFDSIANAKSFLLNINNYSLKATVAGSTNETTIKSLKAYVKIDSLGKLYGVGDCSVSTTMTFEDGETKTQDIVGKVLFQDGKMYVYAYNQGFEGEFFGEVTNPSVSKDYQICISQDYILNNMDLDMDMVGEVVDEELIETVNGIWDSILNAGDSPLNKAIAKVINFIFTRTETEEGYSYKLNPTFVKVMYNKLKEEKVDGLFNSVFGEGAYDATVTYLKESLEKTVPEFEAEAKTELAKWGITADTIYTILEERTGIKVDDMIAEMGEVKLYQLLNQMTGMELDAQGYIDTIDQYSAMLKESTVFDFISNATSEEGVEIDVIDSEIVKIMDGVVAALDKASIGYTTNKSGEFISSNVTFNGFTYSYENEENSDIKVEVAINGTISYAINQSDLTDYSYLITDQSKIDEALNITGPIHIGETYYGTGGNFFPGIDFDDVIVAPKGNININGTSGPIYDFDDIVISPSFPIITLLKGPRYTIIPYNGELYVWQYGDTTITNEISSEDVTFNGQECVKKHVQVYDLYKINKDFMMSSTDCAGWMLIELSKEYTYETVELNIWLEKAEEGKRPKVLGLEFANAEADYDFYGDRSMSFYYSPETKEYSDYSNHTYALTETVEPNGCEYGYRRYECTVCGVSYKNMFGEGHRTTRVAELLEGSKTCLDGVKVSYVCEKCGITDYSYTTEGHHETIRKKIVVETDKVCGAIWLNYGECACGQTKEFYEYDITTDHQFDYTGTDENGFRIYTCAVEGCGITYKYDWNSEYNYYPEKEETCWNTTTDTVIILGKTYAFTSAYPSHNTSYKWSEDGKTEYYYCNLCQETFSEYRYDEYRRTIYYKNYESGYWYERVFNLCDYIQTSYDEDGEQRISNGTVHAGYEYRTVVEETCSQYGIRERSCTLCGDVEYQTVYSPLYWWGYYGDDNHNWTYDEESNLYVCLECGTKSSLGADGKIILEDMSSVGEFKVGYFNKNSFNMQSNVIFDIILNYQSDGSGILVQDSLSYMYIEDTTKYEYEGEYARESGIITIDLDALLEVINNQDVEVTTVSFVATTRETSKTDFDENGNPTEFLLAHAITFELSELYGE